MASLSIGSIGQRRGGRVKDPRLVALGAALSAVGAAMRRAADADTEEEKEKALAEVAKAKAVADREQAAFGRLPGQLDTIESPAALGALGSIFSGSQFEGQAGEAISARGGELNAAEAEQTIAAAEARIGEDLGLDATARAKKSSDVQSLETSLAARSDRLARGELPPPGEATSTIRGLRKNLATSERLEAAEAAEAEKTAEIKRADDVRDAIDDAGSADEARARVQELTGEISPEHEALIEGVHGARTEEAEAEALAKSQEVTLSLLTPEARTRYLASAAQGKPFKFADTDWVTPEAKEEAEVIAGRKLIDSILSAFSASLGGAAGTGDASLLGLLGSKEGLTEIDATQLNVARQRAARLAVESLKFYTEQWGPEAATRVFLKLSPLIRDFMLKFDAPNRFVETPEQSVE